MSPLLHCRVSGGVNMIYPPSPPLHNISYVWGKGFPITFVCLLKWLLCYHWRLQPCSSFTTVEWIHFCCGKILPACCKPMSVCLGFSLIYSMWACVGRVWSTNLTEILNKVKCKFSEISSLIHRLSESRMDPNTLFMPPAGKNEWRSFQIYFTIYNNRGHINWSATTLETFCC